MRILIVALGAGLGGVSRYLLLSRDLQFSVVICSLGEKVIDDPRSAIERPAAFSGMADGASPAWRSIGALARPAPMVRRGLGHMTLHKYRHSGVSRI